MNISLSKTLSHNPFLSSFSRNVKMSKNPHGGGPHVNHRPDTNDHRPYTNDHRPHTNHLPHLKHGPHTSEGV
jgi:hypothetical protein